MIRDDAFLSANQQDIAAKIVDGEAILINLMSGLYYSMDKAGAFVWSLLAAGTTVDRMAEAVATRYGISQELARADLRPLVAELLAEGLVQPAEGAAADAATAAPDLPSAEAYEAPRLQKYDDMAEMFALDPPLPELPAVDGRAQTGN